MSSATPRQPIVSASGERNGSTCMSTPGHFARTRIASRFRATHQSAASLPDPDSAHRRNSVSSSQPAFPTQSARVEIRSPIRGDPQLPVGRPQHDGHLRHQQSQLPFRGGIGIVGTSARALSIIPVTRPSSLRIAVFRTETQTQLPSFFIRSVVSLRRTSPLRKSSNVASSTGTSYIGTSCASDCALTSSSV